MTLPKGFSAYTEVRQLANQCPQFGPDDEDEHTDSALVSCYNCRYRRWLIDGFECRRPQ
ncbi:hypothetical protein [Ferrimonas balearica]|uniref:hypothetical protein n=1 Tax=Ferrimonas balearica TaxID=44012 RepID=UPI001F1B33AF|nr:hypothetical protein [Ferrimonas balearica]MBY6018208.1 hypothetical protein [Halomonas denitrificans]MBY6094548.1 hypothetical protein [Ferrimonas balearica]